MKSPVCSGPKLIQESYREVRRVERELSEVENGNAARDRWSRAAM